MDGDGMTIVLQVEHDGTTLTIRQHGHRYLCESDGTSHRTLDAALCHIDEAHGQWVLGQPLVVHTDIRHHIRVAVERRSRTLADEYAGGWAQVQQVWRTRCGPYQNRVTPWGTLIESSARGDLLGNRGTIHNKHGRILAPFYKSTKGWIYCDPHYAGGPKNHPLMEEGRYTHLFFLDEVTALAAGHRPCHMCKRTRYHDFCQCAGFTGKKCAPPLNAQLFQESTNRDTTPQPLAEMPDGVFIHFPEMPTLAYLVWGDALYAWSPAGYTHHIARSTSALVVVLTPPTSITAIRAGFVPSVHESMACAPPH